MAFIETQFPPNISRGAVFSPTFNTTVTKNLGGFRKANANWDFELRLFDCTQAIKSNADRNTVIAFHKVMKGRANSFRFKDWSDYFMVQEAMIPRVGGVLDLTTPAVGDGTTTAFQIVKRYTVAGNTYIRVVQKPVAAANHTPLSGGVTQAVRVNGVAVAAPGDYTIATTTGIVTFAVAPPIGQIADITTEYDIPTAFLEDKLDIEQFNPLFSNLPCKLEEILLEIT